MPKDLAHAFRSLMRTPLSAGAAVLTVALVLGAGVSLVALVEDVLWTPLPYAAPDALVQVGETPRPDPDAAMRPITRSTFDAWQSASAGVFVALEAYDAMNVTVTGSGLADRAGANRVTPSFFATLGVQPALGRLPGPDDADRVVVIAHRYWRAQFNADPAALGRVLVIGSQPHTVVGVLPEGFRFPIADADLWMPLPPAADSGRFLRVVGRLTPVTTTAVAATALDAVSAGSSPPSRAVVRPLHDAVIGNAAATLWLLVAAAAFALVMAAANLAGLLLMRWADRERELTVRAALGAGRWALVRTVVAESHLIVAAGTAGGLILALWLTPLTRRLAGEQIGTMLSSATGFGSKTAWLLVAGSLFAAWLSAAQPIVRAWQTTRTLDLGQRGSTRRLRGLAGRGLIIGQVIVSFVLLTALVLVGQSLERLLSTKAGFTTDRVLTMRVSIPAAVYRDSASVVAFYDRLQLLLRETLGPSVAIVDELPLTHDRGRVAVALAPGVEPADAVIRTAGPGYFEVMEIPLHGGRTFDATDRADAPPRVILGATLARRLFSDRDPAGQRLWLPNGKTWADVAGVVGDVKLASLGEPDITLIYVSALQQPSRSSHIVVRSSRPDADVLAEARRVVASIDPDVPVYAALPLEDVVRQSAGLPERRVLAAAFSAFTMLALAVTAVGLFGLLGHHVATRRREIAVRMSLGASPGLLRASIVRQTVVLTLAGIAVGTLLSIPASAAVRTMIGDAGSLALTPYLVAAAVLLLVASLAGWGPAERAARTDPAVMLRAE